MAPRRPLFVAVALVVLATIFFISRFGSHDVAHLKEIEHLIQTGSDKIKDLGKSKDVGGGPCSEHLGWLEPYQFSYPINYVARDILTIPSGNGERPALTVMDEPLFEGFTTIDIPSSSTAKFSKCLPPIKLTVARNNMGPVDASNMIFGLQTTINRLKATVKHLARWLPNTGARLFAIVIDNEGDQERVADDGAMAKLEKEFHDLGMNVTIVHPVRPVDIFAQRYFSLVSLMYAARDEKTQWINLIDDDTFFPSMQDLQNELSRYDATKPHYLGSLSEDWWAVNHYGLMGFGGAGILLSLPLAKIIDDNMDDCKEKPRTTAGDITVMDCIYRHSTTKLTHLPGLHQVDMHGDLAGFYESGREMLSLHHWKEGSAAGYKLEMEKMHLVADICDSCFLQRWQFPKDTVLANGFSVSMYTQGSISGQKTKLGLNVQKLNLDEMEQTWGDDINVLHSLAPARPKLGDDVKTGYKLLDSMLMNSDPAMQGPGDMVRQIYFKEGAEKGGGGKEMDTVVVLNWRKGEAPPPPPPSPPVRRL